MKVRELIEKLQAHNPEAEIILPLESDSFDVYTGEIFVHSRPLYNQNPHFVHYRNTEGLPLTDCVVIRRAKP